MAVDSASVEIYVYSPSQHDIFVYDTNGNYKDKIYIQGVYNGAFFRVRDKFIFLNENSAKAYVMDSAGRSSDGL